jgi:hypothetical protein
VGVGLCNEANTLRLYNFLCQFSILSRKPQVLVAPTRPRLPGSHPCASYGVAPTLLPLLVHWLGCKVKSAV